MLEMILVFSSVIYLAWIAGLCLGDVIAEWWR
jgi:hypothetical protein